MKKSFELRSLGRRRVDGNYEAVMYELDRGFYKTVVFMDYSRKEIYHKLRHEYDCIVGRQFR